MSGPWNLLTILSWAQLTKCLKLNPNLEPPVALGKKFYIINEKSWIQLYVVMLSWNWFDYVFSRCLKDWLTFHLVISWVHHLPIKEKIQRITWILIPWNQRHRVHIFLSWSLCFSQERSGSPQPHVHGNMIPLCYS